MRAVDPPHEAHNRAALGDDRVWTLFDELPTAAYVWRVDGDDLILVAHNAAALTNSGGTAPAWLGRAASQVYRDEPEILADLRRCAADGSTFGREMDYTVPDSGDTFRIRVTYAAMPPDLVVVHVLNVTDEITLQEDLRRSAAELSRLTRERARIEREADEATSRERERLAAELHDHAIQSMTAAGLRLDALRRRASPDEQDALREINELLSESIERLRALTA
jgi:signal transduction histidine kinase